MKDMEKETAAPVDLENAGEEFSAWDFLKGMVDDSVERLREKAESGDADAQYDLGMLYLKGRGVEKNEDEGFHWLKMALLQDHADATYEIGWMFLKGEIIEYSFLNAIRCLLHAKSLGHEQAAKDLEKLRKR